MSLIGGISSVGEMVNAVFSRDGRLHVVSGGNPKTYQTTGAAAISLTTTVAKDYGRPYKLLSASATFSTAPTTSQNLVVTRNTYNAQRPSVVVFSVDPSASSATSIVQHWEGGMVIPAGDELVLTYTNTDTRTIDAEVVVEIL